MNWLEQLYKFRDQLSAFWKAPGALFSEMEGEHVLLVEIIAALVLLLILLFILCKPSKKKPALPVDKNSYGPTVQAVHMWEVNKNSASESAVRQSGHRDIPLGISKMVKAVQEQAHQKILKKEMPLPNEVKAPGWQELSQEEEAALAQAMEVAGKQAVAETIGAPHQAEFFEEKNVAKEAVKKMFSGEAKAIKIVDEPARKLEESKQKEVGKGACVDFLMLYYIAPRSQSYRVASLFPVFESLALHFGTQGVFEYADSDGLQFFVASALKPGTFDLHPEAETPGLSFIIDLRQVRDGSAAFNKMLSCLDQLTEKLRGDILDERRQRLTQLGMHEYLARIKSFYSKIPR